MFSLHCIRGTVEITDQSQAQYLLLSGSVYKMSLFDAME